VCHAATSLGQQAAQRWHFASAAVAGTPWPGRQPGPLTSSTTPSSPRRTTRSASQAPTGQAQRKMRPAHPRPCERSYTGVHTRGRVPCEQPRLRLDVCVAVLASGCLVKRRGGVPTRRDVAAGRSEVARILNAGQAVQCCLRRHGLRCVLSTCKPLLLRLCLTMAECLLDRKGRPPGLQSVKSYSSQARKRMCHSSSAV